MKIEEKSTQLGIDLAQIALDHYPVKKCFKNNAFHCFTIDSEGTPIHILDDNNVKINKTSFKWHNDTLAENSTLADVELAFKDYINAQEFIAIDSTVVTYEDLV